MVRFLHTSDWQLGMKALVAGEKAPLVRAKRFEAAARLVEVARRERADFVILAGDTFEHHDVDELVVRRAVEILQRLAPIPVFVLPGNHDPLVAGGVWDRQSWKRRGDHVRLLDGPREVEAPGGVALYPCPLRQKRSALDPTAWIPPRVPGDDRVRVGVAHGALQLLPDVQNFPIPPDRPSTSGLDYLALGDWHSFLQHGRAAYSGTLEQTSFDEQAPGVALTVELNRAGATPRITPHRVGGLRWRQREARVSDVSDVDDLEGWTKEGGDPATLLLRLRVTRDGNAPPEVATALDLLRRDLEERALLLDWTEEGPSSALAVLPEGVISQVDRALLDLMEGRAVGIDVSSLPSTPAVARSARALLHDLARGKGGRAP